jgi:hypothetical protein
MFLIESIDWYSPSWESWLAVETFVSSVTSMKLQMTIPRPFVLEKSQTNRTLEWHVVFMTLYTKDKEKIHFYHRNSTTPTMNYSQSKNFVACVEKVIKCNPLSIPSTVAVSFISQSTFNAIKREVKCKIMTGTGTKPSAFYHLQVTYFHKPCDIVVKQ